MTATWTTRRDGEQHAGKQALHAFTVEKMADGGFRAQWSATVRDSGETFVLADGPRRETRQLANADLRSLYAQRLRDGACPVAPEDA